MLREKIKKIQNGILAIGFQPEPGKLNIVGSGFVISKEGKVLTASHVYMQTPEDQRKNLVGLVFVKQDESGIGQYNLFPLTFIKKNDADDLAVFQLTTCPPELLIPLELGNSDEVFMGDSCYFIGFPYAAELITTGLGITLIVNQAIISNVKQDGVHQNHPRNWFIVDAISNPGNSGCPLIDLDTNKVIGLMSISFSKSSINTPALDIREPMHIAGAKPINLAKELLK